MCMYLYTRISLHECTYTYYMLYTCSRATHSHRPMFMVTVADSLASRRAQAHRFLSEDLLVQGIRLGRPAWRQATDASPREIWSITPVTRVYSYDVLWMVFLVKWAKTHNTIFGDAVTRVILKYSYGPK